MPVNFRSSPNVFGGTRFGEREIMEYLDGSDYSGLMLAARITFAQLGVFGNELAKTARRHRLWNAADASKLRH